MSQQSETPEMASAVAKARAALDAHTYETVQWHFHDSTGCPFWLEQKQTLKFDPLKEINADIAAIGACLSSRTRRLREQGLDFYDVADELAAENEYLKGLGLPVNLQATNAELIGVANA